MENVKFIIDNLGLDSNGDLMTKDCIKVPDKRKRFPILINFDEMKPVGFAEVIKEDGKLMAIADIPDQYIDLYPAIGFEIISHEQNEHGGRTITNAKLYAIGLSDKPNVDDFIKTISDQLSFINH